MINRTRPRFEKKERLALSLLASLPLPLFLTLCGPLAAFSANREELGFSASDFMPLCVLVGTLSVIAVFLLLFFLPDGGFRIVFPVILALSLSGVILPIVNRRSGLPGDTLSEPSGLQNVLGIVIPVLLILSALAAFLFVKRTFPLTVLSCLILIPLLFSALVTFVSIPLKDHAVFKKQAADPRRAGTVTTEGLTDLGEEGTVLYICIDRLDELFCRVAEQRDPTIFAALDGFTRYTDHVSLYSNTYPAVCYMLTGYEADPGLSRAKNFENGYSSAHLLGALSDAGYSTGIYADGYYSFGTVKNIADYADNLISDGRYEIEWKTDLAFEMLAVSLFRIAPSVTSPLFADLSTELLTDHVTLVPADSSLVIYDTENDATAREIERLGFSVRSGKRFSYVHIEGMHSILYGNADPEKTTKTLKDCFAIVNAYLDALREAGLYRDATVVITGDHPSPISDWSPVFEPRVTALFVKRRGDAETPLKVSAAQVSQGQIASEILDSEGIALCDGDPLPLSKTPEGETVERFHHFVVQTADGFRFETYRITGRSDDFANWKSISSDRYKKSIYD